jgi:hypothetical protein
MALTQFIKTDGGKLDAHKEKLNELFERCCGYIKGHSNPMEIHNDPTMVELKNDFETFKAIRALFVKYTQGPALMLRVPQQDSPRSNKRRREVAF